MTKIYLVRHGESQWNIIKKIQGQQDIPLTKKGIKQAQLVANSLAGKNIEIIYTSDLSRAYTTAKIIGEKLKLKVNANKGLREINFGKWEGLIYNKIPIEEEENFLLWKQEPQNLKIDGAETLLELQIRALNEVNKIINSRKYKNILIVSHSATIKAIILGLLDMELKHFKNLSIGNVSITIIEIDKDKKVLKLLNDISHIKKQNNLFDF